MEGARLNVGLERENKGDASAQPGTDACFQSYFAALNTSDGEMLRVS